jgi:hypothetical protein
MKRRRQKIDNISLCRLVPVFFLTVFFTDAGAQGPSFLQKMRFGFGGGINFSQVNAKDEFRLYEDLAGNTSSNKYSGLFQNFGNQYFIQAEYLAGPVVISIRPGTYSYRFSRENTLVFDGSEEVQVNHFVLRYFNIPLDVKYIAPGERLRPCIGATVTWGNLMGSGKGEYTGFISNRFTLGITGGAYYDTGFMTLLLSVGYQKGLHVITMKNDRYNTAVSNSFSQSDLSIDEIYANLSLLFTLQKQRFKSRLKCKYPYR